MPDVFDQPNCGFRRFYPDWDWGRWNHFGVSRERTVSGVTVSNWTTIDIGPLQLVFRKVTLRED